MRRTFRAEIALHFGLENHTEAPVLVFQDVSVCLKCGQARFEVPETELKPLIKHSPKRLLIFKGSGQYGWVCWDDFS